MPNHRNRLRRLRHKIAACRAIADAEHVLVITLTREQMIRVMADMPVEVSTYRVQLPDYLCYKVIRGIAANKDHVDMILERILFEVQAEELLR